MYWANAQALGVKPCPPTMGTAWAGAAVMMSAAAKAAAVFMVGLSFGAPCVPVFGATCVFVFGSP